MTTLLLTLSAPLQSWGTTPRFGTYATQDHPSLSGVIGLLAAALGRRRTDPIEDLLQVRFGVRIDEPGSLVSDFHSKHRPGAAYSSISHRYYRADAVFLAAVEGDGALIGTLREALRRPVFPLFLGRRACPPAGPIRAESHERTMREVLETTPWQAPKRLRSKRSESVALDIVADADPADDARSDVIESLVRDVPVSFAPTARDFGVRRVVRYRSMIPNPDGVRSAESEPHPLVVGGHNPMQALEV